MSSGRPTVAAARCARHFDRAAHALCMSCKLGFCAECATEWEGINYCHSCLAQVRGNVRADRSRFLPLLTLSLTVVLGYLLTRTIAWGAVFFSLF